MSDYIYENSVSLLKIHKINTEQIFLTFKNFIQINYISHLIQFFVTILFVNVELVTTHSQDIWYEE
ncbi:hypothetical protein pb186bvf_003299 [Paramecium bursaria]